MMSFGAMRWQCTLTQSTLRQISVSVLPKLAATESAEFISQTTAVAGHAITAVDEVIGSMNIGESDLLVASQILPKSGPALQVDWRVRLKDGKYRVIDAMVEGISMGVTQRSDFASVIEQGGGKISVLLETLKKRGKSSKNNGGAEIARSEPAKTSKN